jgi:hypothetical protein
LSNNGDGNLVARVKEQYLFKDDLKKILPKDLSPSDSALFVNAYVNRWARRHLLMEGAQRNLSDQQQQNFDELVSQYRTDLYTKAYLDGLVQQAIDTVISNDEIQGFYELNNESFKLNENLIRLRYIKLAQSALNKEEITERFQRYDSLDRSVLDSIAVQFNSYSLRDSVWVSSSQVMKKIPVLNAQDEDELLKISNFMQLKDSINLYLIKVVDVRKENEHAPLQYVLPSIKQMVLNKRKLELIKQLETDIIKDAIQTNDFEIYE